MRSFQKPKTSNLYTLLYILLASITSVTATCYDPNGDIESDPIFQPCGNSMCCATNRTNPSGGNYANGYTADICLENGLCENKIHVTYGDKTTLVTLYYRDYCTSSNWTDGGCLDVCTEKTVCFTKERALGYLLVQDTDKFYYVYIRILVLASRILRLSWLLATERQIHLPGAVVLLHRAVVVTVLYQ